MEILINELELAQELHKNGSTVLDKSEKKIQKGVFFDEHERENIVEYK